MDPLKKTYAQIVIDGLSKENKNNKNEELDKVDNNNIDQVINSLNNGAHVDAMNLFKKTYAQVVIDNLLEEESKSLLHDVDKVVIDNLLEDENKALLRAVENNNIDQVLNSLNNGAHVDTMNYNKRTALIYAAKLGHTKICKILLKYKADIEAENHKGRTALFMAVKKGHVSTAKLLVKYKANTGIMDNYGYTLNNIRWSQMYNIIKLQYIKYCQIIYRHKLLYRKKKRPCISKKLYDELRYPKILSILISEYC